MQATDPARRLLTREEREQQSQKMKQWWLIANLCAVLRRWQPGPRNTSLGAFPRNPVTARFQRRRAGSGYEPA